MDDPTVTIPLADYRRLIEAAENDDMIVTCEVCGAWLDVNEPECARAEDFIGCWKAATGREQESSLCRSYRATVMEGV